MRVRIDGTRCGIVELCDEYRMNQGFNIRRRLRTREARKDPNRFRFIFAIIQKSYANGVPREQCRIDVCQELPIGGEGGAMRSRRRLRRGGFV
jgi:hypothetical protein